jgi:MoaA/NifB/PqqE/SkfB family radical SAM enzyme
MRTWKNIRRDTQMYISRALNTGVAPPDRVSVNLTLRCNLTCTMCTTCYDSPELSLQEIQSIIDQTAKWGVEVFNPLGGEPFMRSDMEEILRYAVRSGFYVTITTNGTLITPSRAKMIASIPADRLHFNISLDGNETSNDLIRGSGMYKKAIQGYKNIRSADQKAGNTKRKILSNTILHAKNIDHFEQVLEEQEKLGFDGIQILNLFRTNDDVPLEANDLWFQSMDIPFLKDLCNRLIARKNARLHSGYQIQNTEKELINIPAYYQQALLPLEAPCWAGWKELYINADGQAIMCDGTLDFINGSFGSIHTETLQQLWRNSQISERRKTVKKCKTPCIQTCYLRQSSDSAKSIAKDSFSLLSKQAIGQLQRSRRSWITQPEALLCLELSDVSHSDYEGNQTPSSRWSELKNNCPQTPNRENWGRFRDDGTINFGRGFMGFELLRQVFSNLASHRLHFGTIALKWRGEPLLHPEIEPILRFVCEWVRKGMFDRIQIETSGVFLTENIASIAQLPIPQEWILDIDDGDGAGLDLILKNLGVHSRVVLHQRAIAGLFAAQTDRRFPNWPVWVGSFPTQGNWLWISRMDYNNFFKDQEADKQIQRLALAHKVSLHNSQNTLNPKAIISWDGKVALCKRDVQLLNAIGEVNHSNFNDLWNSIESIPASRIIGDSARQLCQGCGQPHS